MMIIFQAGTSHTNPLSKTLFSVSDLSRALFKRFQRFGLFLAGRFTI